MFRDRTLTASLSSLMDEARKHIPDKLIFFDALGNRFEKPVPPQIIAQAIKIFDGSARSLARTGGGLSTVHPTELLVYPKEDGGVELRVRVQFRDVRIRHNQLVYLTHSKIADMTALGGAPDFLLHLPQRYVVDFGAGIVPVYIVAVTRRQAKDAAPTAYFIDPREWENLLSLPPGELVAVQPYAVPADIVRLAAGSDLSTGKTHFEVAMQNLAQLGAQGKPIYPDLLRAGAHIELPTGERAEDLRHSLKICLDSPGPENSTLTRVHLSPEEEAGLIPFGLFE